MAYSVLAIVFAVGGLQSLHNHQRHFRGIPTSDAHPLLPPHPIPPTHLRRLYRLRAIGNSTHNTRASSGKTVFSKMADSGEKLRLSEDTILQEACNLTIAGTDTTVVALTYLVQAVLRHPKVQAKLQVD